MDSFRPATSSELTTVKDISSLFGTYSVVLLWTTSRSESERHVRCLFISREKMVKKGRYSYHRLRSGSSRKCRHVRARAKSKTGELEKIVDETVAHLVMPSLKLRNFPFSQFLCFLRTAQKATLVPILCSGQVKTESSATTSERVVLSNETASIASILPEVLSCPTETVQSPTKTNVTSVNFIFVAWNKFKTPADERYAIAYVRLRCS